MPAEPPGAVYARLLTIDDPDADQRLAEEAGAILTNAGIPVRVEMPATRGGMGAGGGLPIDGWVYVVLSVGVGAMGGVLGGFVGAVGSDLWAGLKGAIRDLRRRPRPASRAIVMLTIRNEAGDEVSIMIRPDDPLDRLDSLNPALLHRVPKTGRTVMVHWDQRLHRWEIELTETPDG